VDNARLEAWVLDIIDRLRSGHPIEDSRVELKREWMPAPSAARRIAGHANAARGQAILWIVGIDEHSKDDPVKGVEGAGFGPWWPQVVAQFVELAPVVRDLNVYLRLPVDAPTMVSPDHDATVVAVIDHPRSAPSTNYFGQSEPPLASWAASASGGDPSTDDFVPGSRRMPTR
jgi:hypothetical protein